MPELPPKPLTIISCSKKRQALYQEHEGREIFVQDKLIETIVVRTESGQHWRLEVPAGFLEDVYRAEVLHPEHEGMHS